MLKAMKGGLWVLILLVIIIGFGIYFFMKNSNNMNHDTPNARKELSADPMESAKNRLAKEEITTEEFKEIKKKLL